MYFRAYGRPLITVMAFKYLGHILITSDYDLPVLVPHLRISWLKSISASVLDEYIYYTKVYKLCCSEIVSYVRLKGKRLNRMTHKKIQVTGGRG